MFIVGARVFESGLIWTEEEACNWTDEMKLGVVG